MWYFYNQISVIIPFSVPICKWEWEGVISKEAFNKRKKTRSDVALTNNRYFFFFNLKKFLKEIALFRQESSCIKKYWLRNEEMEKIKSLQVPEILQSRLLTTTHYTHMHTLTPTDYLTNSVLPGSSGLWKWSVKRRQEFMLQTPCFTWLYEKG